jgi:hypothetical protein
MDQILVDEATAARMLNMSLRWLIERRLAGDGPEYLKLGNRIRYRPEDVSKWVINQKDKSHEHNSCRPKNKGTDK